MNMTQQSVARTALTQVYRQWKIQGGQSISLWGLWPYLIILLPNYAHAIQTSGLLSYSILTKYTMMLLKLHSVAYFQFPLEIVCFCSTQKGGGEEPPRLA